MLWKGTKFSKEARGCILEEPHPSKSDIVGLHCLSLCLLAGSPCVLLATTHRQVILLWSPEGIRKQCLDSLEILCYLLYTLAVSLAKVFIALELGKAVQIREKKPVPRLWTRACHVPNSYLTPYKAQ